MLYIMRAMNVLFRPTFTTHDRELTNFLSNTVHRRFLELLWQEYYPYIKAEEMEFRDLKAQPHARIWEMYLAVALRHCRFDLVDKRAEGPDIQLRNPTVWVEAVVSTDGAKEGSNCIQPVAEVPDLLLSESMWGGPPEDKIILRCLTSIDAKLKKLNGYYDSKGNPRPGYIDKGIVKETDSYVVALNTYKTSFTQFDHQYTPNHIPTIVKALFGYGEAVVLGSSNKINYRYRRRVKKTQVGTDIFFQKEYSGVSALIISKEGFGVGNTESPPISVRISSWFIIR